MAAILSKGRWVNNKMAEGNFWCIFLMNMFEYWFTFDRSLFLSVNANKPTLVQVMAWYQKDVKPLPESNFDGDK